jgi:rhomboid protease GluP
MPLVEIFRSTQSTTCEHYAFMLRAVGIRSETLFQENVFALFVEADVEPTARDHIARYEAENAPTEKPKPPLALHERAWIAPLAYAIALVAIGYMAGRNSFGFDWYAAGALPSAIQSGHEFWRAVTALTLHSDHQHLIGNIAFGAFFSYVAARLLGPGVAVASMLAAAALGNLLDSALMPNSHIAIGASTAVFATLGLISAYSWHLRLDRRQKWAHRWAPLIAGIMLLGFLGSGGENTDVLAHLTGFLYGALFGVGLARISRDRFFASWLQYCAGTATLMVLAGAWIWAKFRA